MLIFQLLVKMRLNTHIKDSIPIHASYRYKLVKSGCLNFFQKRRAIEALKARAPPPQTVWRLWLIVYRTELKVSFCA